jgi:hypothetical protein
MANRSCPLCFVKLPRTSILVRSDELTCASCHSLLELSRSSRVRAALLGVVAAFVAARAVVTGRLEAGWFTAVVAAVVVYGAGSALFLLFFSDLVVRPKAPTVFPQIHG